MSNTIGLGATVLGRWLICTGVRVPDFAAAIGVSPDAVFGYLAGRFRPALLTALRIEKHTSTVRAVMWLTREEFDDLAETVVWKTRQEEASHE